MLPSSLCSLLHRRQATGFDFSRQLNTARVHTLTVSDEKVIENGHGGGVTWLDLERVEHRYLLAGGADASVAAYDVQEPSKRHGALDEHAPVFRLEKGHLGAHKFSVTSVAWYSVDTGLFITGSFDESVKVWDSNTLVSACSFGIEARVHMVAMSPVADAHCLVAVGSSNPAVVLCDPRTGGFTHTLTGHREAVWALAWAVHSSWYLASGGCDGQIRLWDIRRAGAAHVFNQHSTAGSDPQALRRQGGPVGGPISRHMVAHDGAVTGLTASPEGLFWISAGTDSRVRLWETQHHRNMLVNYPNTHNRASKARQLAVSSETGELFHLSGSVVQCLDLYQGTQHRLLRGHFDSLNAVCWNPVQQELYTGANDSLLCVWAPEKKDRLLEAAKRAGQQLDDYSEGALSRLEV